MLWMPMQRNVKGGSVSSSYGLCERVLAFIMWRCEEVAMGSGSERTQVIAQGGPRAQWEHAVIFWLRHVARFTQSAESIIKTANGCLRRQGSARSPAEGVRLAPHIK